MHLIGGFDLAEKKSGKQRKDKAPAAEVNPDFKFIVRVRNTDIDGNKRFIDGLTSIKGINYRISKIITRKLGIDPSMKSGDLTDEQVEGLAKFLEEIPTHIPMWMMNRQRDIDTGEDTHTLGSDLDMIHSEDIGLLRKIRCYKGVRHDGGHKVRGQRSGSNGRTGATVGVSRRKQH